jgi:hypothetical protein
MTNPAEIKETVGRAYASLNDPKPVADFKQIMNTTGLGNNAAVVEVVHRLAKATVGPARPSLARSLYPRHD